ncbi:tyrosine-type recombinase/integrase [Actinacidiphila rubida]|uniref:Site-specific recombinase XerD n=1 Tax=Actinacidiphila rubida TaxID=310780 RepID=A0A1H8TCB7_9ACTN|nr:tyrosine-type recombinase/integrase [Actinacidiphila rubida]SEO88148.1 Site-specific recombinase XerD [Actinacidiphila rubida]
MKEPIRKVTHKDGRTRFRLVVDIGVDDDGKRRQLTRTFDTKKEALGELSRIRHQMRQGTFVAPSAMTVDELLDVWLASATRDVEEGTASNYDSAIRPVRTHLGGKKIQTLTEEDVEGLVDWMLTSGRRRGGQPGSGLGVRSVRLTLGRLRSALNLAVRRQWVVRNVAEHATISREAKRKADAHKARNAPWSETEVKTFLAAIREDRLYAAMMLALIANRPAEVCGARWEDVDLDGAGTITIDNTRTIVYDRTRDKGDRNKVVEKGTKTEAGRRTLPLPVPVRKALRAFNAQQAQERLKAGAAYSHSGYLLVDETGHPWKTDKLRREAYKLMAAAGVRKVRLYDARHACLSWMANNGVPDTVVSAWAGHSDLSFTKRTYVHPDPESLRAGSKKLKKLLG